MRRLTAVSACCLMVIAASQASAQDSPPPAEIDPHVEADALFKRMLVKPNDLDAAFRYSQIETKLGDYEAAIGALERMLFYNPNLPRVKLELGVLYFRLRSYEMARSYFTAAIAAKDTPDDVREEVATFIVAIDRAVADNQFSMYVQAGLRHQSNGNAGPNSPLIEAGGLNGYLLARQFQRTPDWNAFGLTTIHHFYDFGDQNADGWESDVTAYYARQFKLRNLDLGLLEVSTGPRLGLGSGLFASVHPYALANIVSLADATYFGTVGGGANLRLELPAAIELDPGVEYRDRQFRNSFNYPTATYQSGHQWIGYVLGTGPLPMVPGLSWQARAALTGDTASYGPYSYTDISVDVSLPYSFAAPSFAQTGLNWTFSPFLGYSHTPYKSPDGFIDSGITRTDTQWRTGATLDMVFYKTLGVALQVQYLHTASTISNYRTNDFIVSGGPTFRF